MNISNSNGGGRHKTFEQKISAMKNASFFDIKPKSPPKLPNPVKKLPKEPKERKFKEEKLKKEKEKKPKDEKIKKEPKEKLLKPFKEKILKQPTSKPVAKEKPSKKALNEEAQAAED